MNKSEYKEICTYKDADIDNERAGWTHKDTDIVIERARWTQKALFRQIVVSSCIWASFFQVGLCVGMPPVLAAQLRREANSTDAFDDEAASWFASTSSFSGSVCVVLMAVLGECSGRRLSYLLMCVTTFASFVVFYCSTTFYLLILSQLLMGPLLGGTTNVIYMIFSEYVSPKYRGVLLPIKSATAYWAIWVANAVGTFFHWKNIGIIGMVCAVYNTSLILFWPESPYWLARKGRMRDCREAHRWLRGTDERSEKELEGLIDSEIKRSKRIEGDTGFKVFVKKISATEFYRPMLLCMLLIITYHISGKLVLTLYSIDIIKKITNDESEAYTQMLILDGVTVLGMYFGCGVSRYIKRRTLLLSTEFVAIVFLFSISLYLYLIKLGSISENVYLSLFFLQGFSLSISCGAMILIMTIVTELLPLELRSFAAVLECVTSNGVKATTVKFAPLTFLTFGIHGGFLSFAVGSLICAILLFKYLPETKDKTLKEIEFMFKDAVKSEFKEEKELEPMTAPEFVKNENSTV